MNFIYLVQSQITKQYIEIKRYALNSIFKLFLRIAVILITIYGINIFLFPKTDLGNLDYTIIMIFLLQHTSQAFSKSADSICQEAQTGSLEQLFATPAGLYKIIMARFVSSFIFLTLSSSILLLFLMLIFKTWLTFSWLKLLTMILFSTVSIYGIGLMLCGLSLLFKQISDVTNFMKLPILFLVTLPALPFNIYSYFPFSLGACAIKQILLNNDHFPVWWYGFILVNSLLYFLMGYWVFNICERRTLILGSIGHQ